MAEESDQSVNSCSQRDAERRKQAIAINSQGMRAILFLTIRFTSSIYNVRNED